METLIEKTFKDLNLGDSFAKSKSSLTSFKEKIEELKQLKNGNDHFLHEYFSKIRKKIDVDRELSKALIDSHYLGLIAEIEKIESECKKRHFIQGIWPFHLRHLKPSLRY